MIDICVDDYDRFGYLNQSVVLKFLNDHGYPATTKTLAKYSNLGLMMLPKGIKFRETNQSARTYYCPLSIIEFMTAYILNRGEYKALRSPKKIAHFTPQELLAGRIAFFCSKPDILQGRSHIIESGLCNFHSYDFIFPEQFMDESHKASIKFHMKEIDCECVSLLKRYLTDFYQSEELAISTMNYIGLLYSETFQALHDRYKDKLY